MNLRIILRFITFLFLTGIVAEQAAAQCTAPIAVSPDSGICGNRTFNFSVGQVTATTFDFASTFIPVGWSSSPYVIGQPCWTYMVDSSTYFWATLRTGGVRFVQTQPLNVSAGGTLRFYMRYGADDPDPGCEDPDLVAEGVYLQYSLNGTTWVDITNWVPNPTKSGPLYVWTQYNIPIPPGAASANTRFRWYQPQNSGDQFDNWGLDDIFIQANIGGILSHSWNFGDSTTSTLAAPTKTYAGSGNYNVTLTVTVSGGCTSTVNRVVRVIPDTIPPTAVTRNIIRSVGSSGTITITPADIDNGSFDNCAITSRSVSPNTFSCSQIGNHAVTLTLSDTFNNIRTATAFVTIVDSVPPVIRNRANLVYYLDNTGNRNLIVSQIDSNTTDNCGLQSITVIPNRVGCSDVGNKTITLVAQDIYNNTSTKNITVTVLDTVRPRARAQDRDVYLNASGWVKITGAFLDNGSSDNCSFTLTATPDSFTCANIGPNIVTLRAQDSSGNFTTATCIVTVFDTVTPIPRTKNITVYLDEFGSYNLQPTEVDSSSSDNCAITTRTVMPDFFTCSDIGANTVTLTLADASANSSNKTATVTVLDTIAPFLFVQDLTVYLDTTNRASITPFEVDMGSYDNCSLDSIWVLPDTFTCANVGNNVVTFFARDVFNNIRSTTLNVTVIDSFPPQVAAKQNVLLYLDSSGTFVFNALLMDSASTDNCGIDSFTVEPPVLTCANLGLQAAVLAAIDLSGTIAYDTFTYTLIDTLRPRVVPRDITAYLNTSGYTKITAIVADSASFDNCSIADRTLSMDSFTCAQLGDNVVWLRVTDNSGNIDSASFTVHIIDTVAPVVITQNINAFLDTAGNAQISPVQANLGSSDNCAIDSMWVVPNSFDCSKRGLASAMLFVRDVSGNTGSAAFGVSVIDTLKPLPLARNLTIYLDTAGVASITATDADSASSDNCAIASRTLSQQLFDCAHLGDNLVYLTIADSSSNHDSVQFTVTVLDTISPVLHLRSIIAYLDATGNVTITAQQLDSASVDNCAISQRSVTPSIFNCTHLGVNTVQFSASDTSGNTTIAFVDISVIDTVRPVVNTQPATIYVDAAGNAAVIAADVNNGSADNCGIDSIWVLPDVITCANLGSNIVTLFVRDSSGNTGSASANVTVLDTIRPNTITQNITVYVNATGNVSIIPAQINNGSTDNCAIDSMVVVPNTFNCSNLGANTVTLTSFDSSGNNSSANATVTVLDTISPVTITKNITVYLDATGNSSIIPADVDNGTLDNCAIDSMSVVPNTLDCSNLGANIVTLTTYDSSGNYSSATATVTVLDTVRPLVFTKNISVYVDASGNAVITASDVNNSSNDNCGIDSMWVIPSVFNCATSGNNQVELFVRDSSGNIASAFANLNVIDTIVPIVLTKTDTVYLNNIGIGSTTASRVNNNSTDNCYIKQMWVVPSSFNCNSIGANTVELFVEDSSGNIASAFAMVIVLDTVAPVISTQPVTVYLDATGVANLTAADVNNGTTDQCKLDTLYLSKNLFNCFDLGANTIQFYAVDSSGNESRSDVQITVADTIRPSIIKRNITVYIDSTGTFKIDPLMVDSASFDNCAIVNRTVSPDTLKCANLGFNTITLTVFDQSGNFISDTLTIELRDTLTPVARAKDITVYLDATGNVAIQPIDIDNGSSDYCKVISIAASQLNFNCTHLGPNIDTLYVTDNGMNTQIALSTVTVVDTISPNNLTKSLHTLYVDANGLVSLLPTDIDSASTDNCTLDSIWVIPNSFDCTNLGTNQVTFYSRDQSGNISQSLTLVEVLDTIRPNTVAQNITVYIDAGGNVNITPTQVNNGSADNCAIDSMSVVPNTFNCSNLGANTVTLTTFDSSGNFSSATATVTVLDTIRPNTIAQNITVYLDATGNVSITPVQVNNGSTDNCAIDSMMVVPNTFDCSKLGANTVTLTTFDSSGNFSTASATVTVLDTIRPNTIAQNITVYVDATGNVSITPVQVNNGSNDNCAIDSMMVVPNTLDCSKLGANTVTLTTFDSSGNFSTASATVTVLDTIRPNTIAQNIAVYLDASGNVSITSAQVNNASNDNCAIDTMTVTPNVFDCSNLGANTVTLTTFDSSGNFSSATATVTVLDTIRPNTIAQNITVYLDATGNVSITPAQVNNGSNDNCAIDTMTVTPNVFDCSNLGANTVTLATFDSSGNFSSATATVTVLDTIRPNTIAQNITVYVDATGNVSITPVQVNNGSNDNCAIDSMMVVPNTFDCSNLGANTVTLTTFDSSGNFSTALATVTVLDTIRPNTIAQNITVYLDATGNVSITPVQVNNGSTDNCAIDSMMVVPNTFDCSNLGANTVTLTTFDSSGNFSSAIATVTVLDTIRPNTITQNITVYVDATGNVSITPAQVNNGSNDNCAIDTMTVTPNVFDCSNLGANTVTLATFDSSGNFSSATATVTVLDTIRPNTIAQNITVYLDATGNVSITPVQVNNGSTDNCAIDSMMVVPNTFDCSNLGANTVTLTTFDSSGNFSTASTIVTVLDTIRPNTIAQNITVYLDASGNVSITSAQVNNASNDNCAIDTMTVTPNVFDCSNLGANTVTLTTFDSSGNFSSAIATVTVLDTIRPNTIAQNITVYLDASGNVSITSAQVNNGSTDNCAIDSMMVVPNTFDCSNLGANTVTLATFDSSGNFSSAIATVTVLDTIRPNTITQNITVYVDATGNVSITPAQVNNGSNDNCAIDTMTVTPNVFDCSNLGANTVTLATFDSSGNFSSATATVTVLDTIRPNTIAQNITVYLDATGNVSITPVQVNNGSTDNCAIDSMMVVPNTFDCSNLGANTVTLTTFDSSGNFSSAIATVTVLDTIRPNTITQNITVYVDATGNVSITPAQVNNGSNDNCAIDTMTVTPNVFDCSNLGANTVTLATFDSSGNFSSANATVTVRDTIHPVAIANGVTVYVDSTGTLTISPSLVNAGSSDNCGIKTLTVVPSIFSCTTLGGNLVTLFVEDFDGNISSDTCIVIVNDTLAPVARAKDTTIYLDANGFVAVTPQTVDNGTLDYCNIQSVSVSPVSFDCSNKGPNTVTYTVTDIWNNTTIVSSTVTVADSTRPVLRAYVITLYLDTNGLATLSVNDVDSGSTDNCGINSRSISQTLFDCSNLGQNIITFTADDTSGNIAQIPVSVTVIDTVRPRVYANNITVYLDTLGVVSITPALLDSASADNCVIANRAISKSTFDCSNKGDNTVELTVTDSSGNVQSVFTNVHVLDTIAPVAVLKNITVYLNADGYSTYTASLLDSASTDNCGIASRTVTPDTLYCAQLGLNTVQVSLADSSGNTIIIDAAVTVIDTIRPTPLVRNIDVYLNAAGYTTITPVMIDSASFDNCSISNLQLDVDSFTCANVGLNTVLLTLKDQSGNVNSKTATVRVIDTIAPVVYASHPVLYLDQNGLVALTAVVADSASTDACGIQQRVVTPSIFNCSQLGITNYTLTVTDVNGNVSSNSATVFILDTIKPQPHTRNINAYLNSDGYVVLNGTDIDSASTDNCSIVSRVISQNTFTCAHLGPNAVTLTLTDQSGNVNQSGAVVTVIDTVKPLPVGKDITVYLNNAGTVTISGADIDSTSTDNCSIVSRIATPSLFGCSNTGFNQVVLSVTDQSGNTGYDTLTVQVLDTIVPVVNTRNITAYLNTSGFVGIAPSQIDSASADACGIDSMWVIPTAYNCSNIGVNTITLFVRDNKGNVSSAAANVSVVDTVAPLIYTKSATLYLDASGKALLTTADVDSASTDNCYIYSKQISKDTFDCSNLGSNIITYHVADSSGNTAQLPVSVTVLDTIRPIAQLKNITAYLDPSGVARFAGIDFDSASFDNCSVNSFTVVPDSFTCAQVGINQVLVSVIDQSGNTQTVPAFVNVLDTIKPDVRIRNILVYLDATGNATITATQVDSSSADNCGIATRTVQPASFTCADVGNNTVVLTVTDVNGNVDSAAGNVLVIDTIRPIASAKPVQRVLNAAGYVTITGTELDSVSSDACGIASYTALPDSFTCANTGNNQIVLKVVDVNGNVSYDTTTIQILDTILPVPAPRVLTAYLQANGRVSITGAQLDSASFDRCGIAAFNVQPDTFSCANLGSNTVTFTVTDVNGNVNSTPAIVIIEDTIAPVPVLHNITVYLNASGSSTISAAMIDSASFDNCTLSSVTLNRTVFGCGEKGAQTVVATLTDQSNNISTAQAVVTVLDTIKPVVRPKQVFAAYLDTLGLVNVVAQSLDSASSDNCGIAQFALSRSTFSCVDLGMNRVVLSVSDSSGNIDTASAWIRVIDTIAPRPSLITVTAYLDTAGRVIVTGSQFNQASVDNCTIDSIAINRSLFTCSDIGTNRVFVTLIDNSGNRASDSATILILDTIRPKPICPAAVTLFAHADTCGRTFVLPTPPVLNIDNCSAVFSSNAPINNYYPVGTTTVLWTATDPSGNTGSCPQNVIVRDTVRPVVRTRNIIAYLNASGNITIAPQMIDSASSDACGIDSIHLDRRTFNCSNIGANVVRLFVTDVNGNVNSATATVNVVDTVRPTLLGRNVVVYLNAAGTITIPPSLLDNGSTDACGSVKLSISDSVFTCTNVGNNTVNLTVTDLYGNFITQPFNVQVRDTVRPVARAKDLVLTLTLPTNLQTITVADVDNGSADACGIDTMWLSKYSFNISNLGNNIVTLTVRDKNGNISSTNFNVFVKENNPPIARCKSIEMTLANGKVVITPQMIDNGSTDETGIVSYTIDRDSFTCADIGNNTVRLTVTDVHGLSASCDATVRIKGVIPKFTPFVEIDKNGPVIGIPDILPDPNQMYIGYGPQTMKLGIKTSDERPFDYVWEGPGILNPTDSAPTFIPLEAGVYNLRATVTNMYGCVNSFTVDACVLDVRDPRPNFNVGEKQVVVCMKPLKNMRDSFSLSVPISEVPAKIAMGARIGHCDMRCGGETMVELVSDNLTYDAVVYPNPTNYTINLKIVTTQIKAQFDFTVFNINGKVVYEQQNQDPFNVISFGEDFEAGLYIVEVKYKEGTRTFSRRYKVIKVN